MVRLPLTADDRERGRLLGEWIRHHRGGRTMTSLAASAGISVETLRKIESGRVPTPALFTVAAIAAELGVSLDEIVAYAMVEGDEREAD